MLTTYPALPDMPLFDGLQLKSHSGHLAADHQDVLFHLAAANAASIKALTPEVPPFGDTPATRCAVRDGIDALASRIGMTVDRICGAPGYHLNPCDWIIDPAALFKPMSSAVTCETSRRLDTPEMAAHLERVRIDAETIERQATRLATRAHGLIEVCDVANMIAALAQQIAWVAVVLAAGRIDAASFDAAFGPTRQTGMFG